MTGTMGLGSEKLSFNRNHKLGGGSYGTVYQGLFEDKPVAVKRILRSNMDDDEFLVFQEIEILRKANGQENIIRLIHTEMDADFLYLVTELCQGSLKDYIVGAYEGLRFEDEKDILRQVTKGLAHLHSLNIVHRDLKPPNILIFVPDSRPTSPLLSKPQMKLADFGLSKVFKSGKTELTNTNMNKPSGTDGWTAPELYESQRYNSMVDIFPLGCIFSFTLTDGKHPFGDDKDSRTNRIRRKENMTLVPEDFKGCVTSKNDAGIVFELIRSMVEMDPLKRPTVDQILEHDFLRTRNKPKFNKARSEGFLNFCRYDLYNFSVHDSDQLLDDIKMDETIDVNIETEDGWRPLHLFCRIFKHDRLIEFVKLLLEKGAVAKAKTRQKWNALHFLCANFRDDDNLVDIATLLIKAGAEVNAETSRGWTPLQLLRENYEDKPLADMIQLFVEHGANSIL